MRVGVIDVDGNNKVKKWGAKPFPNLALAKLSRFHKQQGDPTKRHQTIPMWQKDLTNWTNKRMIFTMTEFKDFEPRKNFKCKEYFK